MCIAAKSSSFQWHKLPTKPNQIIFKLWIGHQSSSCFYICLAGVESGAPGARVGDATPAAGTNCSRMSDTPAGASDARVGDTPAWIAHRAPWHKYYVAEETYKSKPIWGISNHTVIVEICTSSVTINMLPTDQKIKQFANCSFNQKDSSVNGMIFVIVWSQRDAQSYNHSSSVPIFNRRS